MKTYCSNQRDRAMTLTETVFVILIIGFFAAVILPAIRPHRHYHSISCTNNLKQLGLAYKIWAGDNRDKYPMEISTNSGGTMELMDTSAAWKTFLVMSNELSTPKVIFCPDDSRSTNAHDFGPGFSAKNISYFIGRDAMDTNPAALLSGDGNFLLNNSATASGPLNVSTNNSLTWDTTRHVSVTKPNWLTKRTVGYGNIGLADGSVQSTSDSNLKSLLNQTGFATNRLFIP